MSWAGGQARLMSICTSAAGNGATAKAIKGRSIERLRVETAVRRTAPCPASRPRRSFEAARQRIRTGTLPQIGPGDFPVHGAGGETAQSVHEHPDKIRQAEERQSVGG